MAVAVALSAVSGCAAVARHPADAPLPYFFNVDERLYRGAHPTPEGFKQLADMGVKTVINLRAENPRHQAQDRAAIESHGMQWVYLPMRAYWHPTEAQVRTFLATVLDPAHTPVFVHCRQGEDRTGSLVAVYRVVAQGWEPHRAYGEARAMGLGPWNPLLRHLVLHDAREKYTPMFLPRSGAAVVTGEGG